MASVPDRSVVELSAACGRLKRALGQVQCALFDLHEAFLQGDPERNRLLQQETRGHLERIRALSRPPRRD